MKKIIEDKQTAGRPKRGRPPIDESLKHGNVVSIRLTKGEIEKLDRYGKIKGLSRSETIQLWLDTIVIEEHK